jgi:hypothetical protein
MRLIVIERSITYLGQAAQKEKAMDTILIALAFVAGLAGLIIVGMRVTLYFYSHEALGLGRSTSVRGLRAITARSVPYETTVGASQSEINLGLSTDPSSRYARGGVMVMALFLMVVLIAIIVLLSTTLH